MSQVARTSNGQGQYKAICRELISAEENYVNTLRTTVDPLTSRVEGRIPREDLSHLLPEQLALQLAVHTKLLSNLKMSIEEKGVGQCILDAIRAYEHDLLAGCMVYLHTHSAMQQYKTQAMRSRCKDFEDILSYRSVNGHSLRMSLPILSLDPVQHFKKYRLLLEELIDSDSKAEDSNLKPALTAVEGLLAAIDALQKDPCVGENHSSVQTGKNWRTRFSQFSRRFSLKAGPIEMLKKLKNLEKSFFKNIKKGIKIRMHQPEDDITDVVVIFGISVAAVVLVVLGVLPSAY